MQVQKIESKQEIALRKTIATQKDMQNCFGFDVSVNRVK